MDELVTGAGERLLVFAPHPDDESLACGGLIQRVLGCGGQVHVVVVTSGDANPWPQRVAERRWRLDAGAPRRWGAVREAEARAALRRLGACERNVRFLGWPDMGITSLLMAHGDACIRRLRELVDRHRPTLVAIPDIHDAHPDHSALGLLLVAALRARPGIRRVLAYRVHEPRLAGVPASRALRLSAAEEAGKREAVSCHLSQLRFGAWRLLRHVDTIERYLPALVPEPQEVTRWQWRFSSTRPSLRRARRLQVVAIGRCGGVHAASFELDGGNGAMSVSRPRRTLLEIGVPALCPGACSVLAKLDFRSRLSIYDASGWVSAEAGAQPLRPLPIPGQAHAPHASFEPDRNALSPEWVDP